MARPEEHMANTSGSPGTRPLPYHCLPIRQRSNSDCATEAPFPSPELKERKATAGVSPRSFPFIHLFWHVHAVCACVCARERAWGICTCAHTQIIINFFDLRQPASFSQSSLGDGESEMDRRCGQTGERT